MPQNTLKPLLLNDTEHRELAQLARGSDPRLAERARILLCRANGLSRDQTAEILGYSKKSVSIWSTRFRKNGLEGLVDLRGRSRRAKSKMAKTRFAAQSSSSSSKNAGPRPPSMRSIAETARVSAMTVSRVLRNDPHVHSETRQRVLEAAQEISYSPDPELGKLMVRLRKRRTSCFKGTICCLEAKAWNRIASGYYQNLVTGAKARAESLGFAWNTYPLETFISNPEHSSRVLHNRGVEGILLPPAPFDTYQHLVSSDSIWKRFAVISATVATRMPACQRVIPDYFRNTMRVCTELSERGHRRIGLALPFSSNRWTKNHQMGAFFSFHRTVNREAIAPLLYRCYNNNKSEQVRLRQWFQQEKPDALVICSSLISDEIVRMLELSPSGPIPIATLLRLDNSVSGINELPERVGSIAAKMLGNMIVNNEKDVPEQPTVTMVEGVWCE